MPAQAAVIIVLSVTKEKALSSTKKFPCHYGNKKYLFIKAGESSSFALCASKEVSVCVILQSLI